MIPYSRPKLSDLCTLSQSKLLENHTLHCGTYLYSPYMAVPPWGRNKFHFGRSCEALWYKYSTWYSFLWRSLFRQPSSFVLYVFFPYPNPPFSLKSIHQQAETVGAQSQYSVRERTLRIKYCLHGSEGPQIDRCGNVASHPTWSN